MQRHGFGIAEGQDEPGGLAMFRADRAKDVGRFRPLVLGCRWPGPASRPAPRDLVLLDDTGFVLEPDLYQGLVAALGGPSRSNLIEASYRSCGRLGIAQGTWGRACQQFGRERAALCVLLIDRNVELPGDHRYKARSPSRWALETLGWAPQYLVRVSLVLARLAETKIAGNWGNNPAGSLLSLYRSWFPQTGATVEQRIAALDVLIARVPDAATHLLNSLAHLGHDVAHHTSRPKWRDDDAGAGYGATGIEHHAMLVAAADRQLKLADQNVAQIAALVGKYGDFDDPRRQAVLELLAGLDGRSDEEKETIQKALRSKIHWHRNYDDQTEVDALLAPLEAAYERLAPSDLIVRHAWLFRSGWIDLPARDQGGDYTQREKSAEQARAEALAAIISEEGWEGVNRLAAHTAAGWQVGFTALNAGMALDDAIAWIAENSGDLSEGAEDTKLAAGVLSAIVRQAGNQIICSMARRWADSRCLMIPSARRFPRLLKAAQSRRSTALFAGGWSIWSSGCTTNLRSRLMRRPWGAS